MPLNRLTSQVSTEAIQIIPGSILYNNIHNYANYILFKLGFTVTDTTWKLDTSEVVSTIMYSDATFPYK
jgi:hypothetical protein